ncbi:nucleotidyltransferase family protein [Streptococcus halichoeri]|uniref:nucleotidyltransferase family protein n=1 Tax=Streptococcus halichoeri TaxID=254785 RepID=UPI000DB5D766|nr:nucleotidyltransferase family protein [Streptococcus halichoeri]PZO95730.1 MAG: hypothetical protein DI617_02890 [Streptococcus pyogenes]
MSVIYMLISENAELMALLSLIKSFGLKDCWLCAGTLRNYVWNQLSGIDKTFTSDLDVIFFDTQMSYEATLELEKRIKQAYPAYDWEIKNEYYMNGHSPNSQPYVSSKDAISKFPEKCTAIAARLDENDHLELFLPYGEEEIVNFLVRPTPYFLEDDLRYAVYLERVKKKHWDRTWAHVRVLER